VCAWRKADVPKTKKSGLISAREREKRKKREKEGRERERKGERKINFLSPDASLAPFGGFP
jgi:hypothetical protein